MKFRYESETQHFITQAGLSAGDIFDYGNSDRYAIFNRFYNFCQDDVDSYCKDAGIQPVLFFFNPSSHANARADKRNGFFLIEIYNGLVDKLYDYLYNYNHAFETSEKLCQKYDLLLPKYVPPGYFTYQAEIQFMYYHECAHLIQRSFQPIVLTDEPYPNNSDEIFEMRSHVYEYDADVDAAYFICRYVLEHWYKLPRARKNVETITSLLALSAVGILTLFAFLEQKETPVYYAANQRPHPAIRIAYIMNFWEDLIEQNWPSFGFKSDNVLKEAFEISALIAAATKRPDPIESCKLMLKTEAGNIAKYIEAITTASKNNPKIIKTRCPRKRIFKSSLATKIRTKMPAVFRILQK